MKMLTLELKEFETDMADSHAKGYHKAASEATAWLTNKSALLAAALDEHDKPHRLMSQRGALILAIADKLGMTDDLKKMLGTTEIELDVSKNT